MTSTVLVVAVVLSGLSAGLFATFDYAVMNGLRRVGDETFVATMRAINTAILNPVLLLVLLGPLVAGGLGAWLVRDDATALGWVLAGVALHVLTLVVTGTGNVPLNDALRDGTDADAAERRAFEGPWNRWNHVRTATSIAALVAFALALRLS